MDYNSRNPHLGVNRLSKPIRKSPIHQPPPPAAAAPPQPQVYNISKNDFRSIVQQLTGTPTRDPANPNPNHPPPLPPPPSRHPPSMRLQRIRPPPLTPIARPPPPIPAPPNPIPRPVWADSPVSAYMRYLETSLQLSPAPPPPPPSLPSPGFPSPTAFLNLLSPRSPYPLLSPGFQHPPPLSPNFSFSPMMSSQQGILGPGPPSPGLRYPLSPSGYLSSPRWRDM